MTKGCLFARANGFRAPGVFRHGVRLASCSRLDVQSDVIGSIRVVYVRLTSMGACCFPLARPHSCMLHITNSRGAITTILYGALNLLTEARLMILEVSLGLYALVPEGHVTLGS